MESIELLLVFSAENNSEKQHIGIWAEKFAHFLEMTMLKIFQKTAKATVLNVEEGINEHVFDKVKFLLPIVNNASYKSPQLSEVIMKFAEKHHHNLESVDNFEKVILLATDDIKEKLKEGHFYGLRHFDFSAIDLKNYLLNMGQSSMLQKHENLFWLKMYDLAVIIINEQEVNTKALKVRDRTKTIYLAKVTPGLRDLRNDIKRDLRRHGFNVVPYTNLVNVDIDNEKEIKSLLKEACMSLHLITDEYGDIVKENKSIIDLQNKIADEHGAGINNQHNDDKFYRTIWLDPNIADVSEEVEIFVGNINRDIEAKDESEFLKLPFEELKVIVRDKLKLKNNYTDCKSVKDKKEGLNIYLVYEKKDMKASEGLKKTLESKGYSVSVPVFDGELFDLEPKHINKLKICDACLVFVDKANNSWLNIKLQDIDKVKGLGRNTAIKTKGVFFFNEMTLNTHINNGTIIMENDKGSVNEILAPFIQKLEV